MHYNIETKECNPVISAGCNNTSSETISSDTFSLETGSTGLGAPNHETPNDQHAHDTTGQALAWSQLDNNAATSSGTVSSEPSDTSNTEIPPLSPLGQWALWHASQGLAVFQLASKSKIPLKGSHGFKDATKDPAEIQRLWTKIPYGNIAAATGEVSGFVVVDVDGQQGWQSFIGLQSRFGSLPSTVTVVTPGKIVNGIHTGQGYHFYFRLPSGITLGSRSNIADHVDLKAEGGYIVLPQSVHPDGTGVYQYAQNMALGEIPIVELPSAWIEFLVDVSPKKTAAAHSEVPVTSSTPKGNSDFDRFVQSGEWRNHLADLEARGWGFFERDGVVYFQTPDGDHSPGKQDGNIKDGMAYFFSKAPIPFENKKGYTVCQVFAGVLFGDIGKKGLAQFAKKYFSSNNQPAMDLPESTIQEPLLTSLLDQISPIDFYANNLLDEGKVTHRTYQVGTIAAIISTAKKNAWGLVLHNGFVYSYNGGYWQVLDVGEFKSFLAAAANRLGVPSLIARHHKFRDELFKQFVCDGHLPPPPESDTTLVNLINGTFEISETKWDLRKPDAADFLIHQLPFEYQPAACAPMFLTFLARVLPEPELQAILAEYIGYVFVVNLKLEKVLFLYGTGANGKSVVFDIVRALLGKENVCSYSLASLTQTNSYQRADLQNKLLNYASELNAKLESAMFKQMVSGESIEARQIYERPFTMHRYARLMFNCNELPTEVENTDAFFRRFIIIPFRQTIPEHEQDPDLAKKIIAMELPGIFNWVLAGLQRLLHNRKFTESDIVRQQVEEYKKESDSVAMFIEEMRYQSSTVAPVPVSTFYAEYRGFCQENGYRALGKKNFTKRCRALGFEIVKERGHVVYAERNLY